MPSEPLFDASIDFCTEAKTLKGVRPILTISIAEVALLNAIIWFCCFCYADEFWKHPRSPLEEGWFHWAPEAARHWMVKMACGAILATSQTLLALIIYPFLPGEWIRRVPIRLLPYGSPPLLGAAIFVVSDLPFILLALLLTSIQD